MRASGYRIAPLAIVLAIVVVLLALTDGCGSGSDDGGTAERKPATPAVPSDASQRVVVWAVGDGADGDREARRVARLIERDRPDRFLYLGDVYDEGTAEEFAENYDTVYGGLAERTAPTPGNHEWFNHAEGYDPYWEKEHGREPHHYYSFRTGGWQIISLNSETEHGPSRRRPPGCARRCAVEARAAWRSGTVRATAPASVTATSPTCSRSGMRSKGRAAVVVNGHEHDMQRFAPRDGITELVSGAGGADLYTVDKQYKGLAFGNDDEFGALRLELSPGAATYRFVTSQGATIDSGKVACKPG